MLPKSHGLKSSNTRDRLHGYSFQSEHSFRPGNRAEVLARYSYIILLKQDFLQHGEKFSFGKIFSPA